jgi:hypothetical protein
MTQIVAAGIRRQPEAPASRTSAPGAGAAS